MIIDTNALSDFLRDRVEVVEKIAAAEWVCLPVIVLGEYRFGLAASRERRALLPKLDACRGSRASHGEEPGKNGVMKTRGHLCAHSADDYSVILSATPSLSEQEIKDDDVDGDEQNDCRA